MNEHNFRDMDVDEGQNKLILDFTDLLQTFIPKLGIQGMLDILEPYYTIFRSERLIMPPKDKIASYVDAFGKVLTTPNNINALFRIYKVIDLKSANGKVLILEVKSSRKQKVIVKVPLTNSADPLSYEYYVGLSLNMLRMRDVPICSLLYSRFVCGVDVEEGEVCGKGDGVSHLVYEYIRSADGTVLSLSEYISKELTEDPDIVQENLLNMLVYLMVYLQKAQDMMAFTHYDLHLDNIMLINVDNEVIEELEYKGKRGKIAMKFIPKLIDYGRAYIKSESAVKRFVYNDIEEKKKYTSFQEFQQAIWQNKSYYLDPQSEQLVNDQITEYSNNQKLMEYAGCRTREELVRKFYLDNENVIKHDIKSYQFNPLSDMFRVTKTICAMVRRIGKLNNVSVWDYWKTLDVKMTESYPFYVPRYYNLPKMYQSLNGRLNSPIELAQEILEDAGSPMAGQIGGGKGENIFEKPPKLSRKLKHLKMKSTFTKQDDFMYVVNDTPEASVKKTSNN
jgi:hypothetical protein